MSDSVAKQSPVTSPPSLPSLPDAVLFTCLARLSRSDLASVSLVSKKYHSLINSNELYKTRLLMGNTKEYLYVCLSSKPESTLLWFILRRDNKLIQIPSSPSHPLKFSSFVALDYGIYVIGGLVNDQHTSSVLLLDCRSNMWRNVPSMRVARASAAAGVVNGKIYVFGGCEEVGSMYWGEVFDPKTQTWESLVPMCDRSEDDNVICESLVVDEKVYATDLCNRSFYYSPSEAKWGRDDEKKKMGVRSLYGCDEYGNVFWRESEEMKWKKVKALEALGKISPRLASRSFEFEKIVRKVSGFGENIVVFWVGPKWDVWCAEISLDRHVEEGEVWGKIEWSEPVATLDHTPFRRVSVEVLYSATVSV